MAAAFKHVGEALQIGVHVGVRMIERIAYAGLGGEMDHMRELSGLEHRVDGAAIGKVQLDETETVVALELPEAGLLEGGIVIGRQAIDAHHVAAVLQQTARHMEADEARSTGDQHRSPGHGRPSSAPCGNSLSPHARGQEH